MDESFILTMAVLLFATLGGVVLAKRKWIDAAGVSDRNPQGLADLDSGTSSLRLEAQDRADADRRRSARAALSDSTEVRVAPGGRPDERGSGYGGSKDGIVREAAE